jgi:hypothetical protein
MFETAELIDNPGDSPLEVWFEPWGITHSLAPGSSFRVVVASREPGSLDVTREGSLVAVYCWPGCTLRVFRGQDLVEDCSIEVPALPPGMSVRSFIGRLFGGPDGTGRRAH